MKKFTLFITSILLFTSSFLISCSNDDGEKSITEYSLEDIYGYTFTCSFTSSSGTSLNPAITIFDENRLDWNMSTTGMGNNQYVYSATKTGINNWTTYWYSADTKAEAENLKNSGDTTKASMIVRLGIDSFEQITCLVKSATDGAGSSMGSTPLSMKKTSAAKNTIPSKWTENSDEIKDIEITIPSSAISCEWTESKTYEGNFVYLIKNLNTNSQGETGDNSTPQITITKTENNTVTVKNVKMHDSSMNMTLMPFDITGVSVKKDGEIYYLSKENFTTQTSDYTEDSSGVKLTGYKITGSKLTGKLESGILTLKVVFKPGSMPFDITEIFTSEN